ncbi:MAG: hypothetical protein MJD61_14990 [Proteobacteria bacterium]|nr:hypothetical protein [Pseudomonadota bacterium]
MGFRTSSKKHLSQALRPGAHWLLLSNLLAACAVETPSAFITATVAANEMCVFGNESAPLLRGIFDISPYCDQAQGSPPGGQVQSYRITVRLENMLIARSSPQGASPPVRADPNLLRITGAEIQLRGQDGSVLAFPDLPGGVVRANPFSVAATATIPAASSDSNGVGFVAVEAIPAPYVESLRTGVGPGAGGVVVVGVRLLGKTLGGTGVKVPEFAHAVQLCNECRVVCIEAIRADENVRSAVESVCNASPGSDLAYCIVDRTVHQRCLLVP